MNTDTTDFHDLLDTNFFSTSNIDIDSLLFSGDNENLLELKNVEGESKKEENKEIEQGFDNYNLNKKDIVFIDKKECNPNKIDEMHLEKVKEDKEDKEDEIIKNKVKANKIDDEIFTLLGINKNCDNEITTTTTTTTTKTKAPTTATAKTKETATTIVPSTTASTTSTSINNISKIKINSEENVFLNIHNIICSANLGIEVDLRYIAISIRNAEYNPRKANTLIIRLRKPNSTALIFHTGRIMLTGTQTVNDAIWGCKKIAKIIKKVTKKKVFFQNFKIENMIATADCNMPVRLELLAHDHKENCNYEPELFAGLIFRYSPNGQHKSVILIFVSGKMVISGCKSVDRLNTVFQDVYNVLKSYNN